MRTKIGSSSATATGPQVMLAAAAACLLLATVLICNLGPSSTAEARYLPTRSIKSETETLKEIIRGLLIESSNANRVQQAAPMYQLVAARPTASFLQRRAAEMSLQSANGDESEGFLGAPAYDLGNQAAAAAFKPSAMSQRPDRR